MVICLKPCTPKPDQIWSNHYWLDKRLNGVLSRLTTWSLEIPVTSSSLCPPAFLSLGQIVPQKSKGSRSFQNLNQQLQMTQMMELFNQLQIETKSTCHSLHVIYVISINFICLSPGKSAMLLHPLNHVNPPICRKMHHSKTSIPVQAEHL